MPRKSTSKAKSSKAAAKTVVSSSTKKFSTPLATPKLPTQFMNSKSLIPIAIALVLGVAFFYGAKKYRGYVVAAMVGRTPITTFELNKTLVARYGSSTLDEIINQKLLAQLAQKENITVSQSDIDAEVKKLEENLGGQEGLKQAMEQYGLTEKELRSQINVRLIQQKLSEKLFKTEVSDEEVKKYFDDNALVYKDKKFDEVKEEIKTNLLAQKLQQQFVDWFQAQKKDAKIQIYLPK